VTGTVLNPEPIVKALHGAFCRDVSAHDLLQVAAAKIKEAGASYSGVYMYLARGDRLELEASAGDPTDQVSVPVGQVVRADLVVRIRLHDQILGEIAIEHGIADAFGEAEVSAVRQVADALAVLL
jgi:putative methionine-R-sulfoxide reductase with GAF domain